MRKNIFITRRESQNWYTRIKYRQLTRVLARASVAMRQIPGRTYRFERRPVYTELQKRAKAFKAGRKHCRFPSFIHLRRRGLA